MKVPEIIEQKVEDFAKNEKALLDPKFGETETRNRFIDPFFKALGWELEQTHLPRRLWDVHREYSQRDNSSTKKPDYAFRLDGKLKFFVEAKAPWVRIIDNPDKDTMFQAKRYAYSTNGKAPIVIITDFQEFRVFNALQRPIYDNSNQGLLKEFDLKYTDYTARWDFLYENFSKEAVTAGSLDRLRGKISKNTKTLDSEFLSEIIAWRENLAKNIAIRNEKLTVDEINEAVQRILDRLVFIRNLEDREIIAENSLLNTATRKEKIYNNLLPLFSELNVNYNGLLFKPHFSEELEVDDKVLKDTIQAMCYPRSPFQFDVIEPEILGRIYEKFLGSKIRLTDSHRAKVEEKEEVRHAGGVYYTPQFIVDTIVKETVGKRIEGLTPEQIEKIRILDPACGSGSFLLGAYSYLMAYHIAFYTKNSTSKKYKDDFFHDASGDVRLTIKKKGEILVNNLWGVDIDREATEVSILSLYLKLLEHGIEDDQGWLFLKGKVLPDMTANIKHGNSLIAREDLFQNDMFGKAGIKIFDWQSETDGFGRIFRESGGFDCIIGNPPYIRIQEMQKWAPTEAELYKKIFKSGAKGNFDIYVLFIEKSLRLLSADGLFGMILPNKFFMADYGESIREQIGKHVYKIVDFSDQQIFENATTYTNLLFLSKSENTKFQYAKIGVLPSEPEAVFDEINSQTEIKRDELLSGIVENDSLTDSTWQFSFGEDKRFFEQLMQVKLTLGDISEKLLVGLQTSADPVFILECIDSKGKYKKLYSKVLDEEVKIESEILKPLLKGKEIRRYSTPEIENLLIFPYKVTANTVTLLSKEMLESQYPLCWEYLSKNKEKLTNRDISGDTKCWWQFGRNQNIVEMSKPKLITQVLASRASYTADLEGKYYFVGGWTAPLKL